MPLTRQAANRKDTNTARSGVLLQHRHYAFIAATIASIEDNHTRYETRMHFADALARTNPRFDRERFMAACGR